VIRESHTKHGELIVSRFLSKKSDRYSQSLITKESQKNHWSIADNPWSKRECQILTW